MNRLGSVLGLFVVVVLVISGCTPPQNAPPPFVAKVSGKVNLDGKAMPEGEVSFTVSGQPPRVIPIKDGEFAGEAFVGKNRVDVVLEKDGPPSTTDKKEPTKINAIQHGKLEADVTKDGANAFTFDVKSSK
jgi:hypothetical protein